MQASLDGQFVQVSEKLEAIAIEIRDGSAEICTKITEDGQLTRDAFQRMSTRSGRLIGHPHLRITDVMHQKSKVFDMLLTPNSMRT